jgi:hypothetical protein
MRRSAENQLQAETGRKVFNAVRAPDAVNNEFGSESHNPL